MVVARNDQYSTARRAAISVTVFERVTRAIYARSLAIPNSENAVDGLVGIGFHLLGPKHRCGCKILIDGRQKLNVVLFKKRCRTPEFLIDGTEFDKSPDGQTFPMTLQVIPGFKEALTTMPIGSKWKIFLPSKLAYGPRAAGPKIGANSALIFELELVEIQAAPPAPIAPPIAPRVPGPPRPRASAVTPPVQVPAPKPAPAPAKKVEKAE